MTKRPPVTDFTVPPEDLERAGYIQEANRIFFHPHGLELHCVTTSGRTHLSVLDLRNRKEGPYIPEMTFEQVERGMALARIWAERAYIRKEILGFDVQPLSAQEIEPNKTSTKED